MYFRGKHATYAYEVVGEGIPIVLLHGFTGSKLTWSSFIAKWQDHFQFITIDLPGHGQTVMRKSGTMKTYCADLNLLLDHLEIDRCHLLGYSMGGRMALSFAVLYPERIRSLLLESSSPGIRSSEEREARRISDEQLAEKIADEGVKAFVDYWEDISLFKTQKALPQHQVAAIRRERLAQSKEGLIASLQTMGTGSQPSWWEQLARVKQSVLLIVGEKDSKFVMMNKEMDKSLPNASLAVVQGAGHAVHVEEAEKFGKLVIGFIMESNS